MIGQTISYYKIVGKLGEGAMGDVYVAKHTVLESRFAIKTLRAARGAANQHYRGRFLKPALSRDFLIRTSRRFTITARPTTASLTS